MSQYVHLSTPDPEYAPVLAKMQPQPPKPAPVVSVYRGIEDTLPQQHLESRLPSADKIRVEDHQIDVTGGEIRIRCMVPTPEDKEATFPVLVWYHGGGFVWGTLKSDDYRLRILCDEMRITIVNVEYRLAPEHPFPASWDDGYAAAKWVAQNASLLSASLEKGFIVGGASAGGNLAATVAHRARDDPVFAKTPITGQLLQCGAYVHPEATFPEYQSELLSTEELKDDPFLSRAGRITFSGWTKAPRTADGYSVLLRDHTGLPPAFLQIAGRDPLRDEQFLYAKLLEKEGINTKVEVYPGLPHCFNYGFPGFAQAVKFENDVREGIKWLLGRSSPESNNTV